MPASLRIVRGVRASRLSLVAGATAVAFAVGFTQAAAVQADDSEATLVQKVQGVTRSTVWQPAGDVPLKFDAFHPQGMVRVGDLWWMSSVEIIERTVRYPSPVDGYDRTPGKGQGHLFAFDDTGALVADIKLGEGNMYHPGGIDYDGENLWVPVAEYRPNSKSVIYRVNPTTRTVAEAFRADDHIGGIVHDTAHGRLIAVSWGSRRLYEFKMSGRVSDMELNESHFVDYQDCDYAAGRQMICTGVTETRGPDGGRIALGGIAVVDTKRLTVGHEVPVFKWSATGASITRNPTDLSLRADGSLQLATVPDDGTEARLLTFTAVG